MNVHFTCVHEHVPLPVHEPLIHGSLCMIFKVWSKTMIHHSGTGKKETFMNGLKVDVHEHG